MKQTCQTCIGFHPGVDELLNQCAIMTDGLADTLRVAIVSAIATRRHEATPARPATQHTRELMQLDIRYLTVFFTVEDAGVLIRGFGNKSLAEKPGYDGPHAVLIDDEDAGEESVH